MMLDGASSRQESNAVLYERDQAAEESQPNLYGQVNDIHIKKQRINYWGKLSNYQERVFQRRKIYIHWLWTFYHLYLKISQNK